MKEKLRFLIIGVAIIIQSASAQTGTWEFQNPSPGANGQNALCVVSADTVYTGSWNGLIGKTINGGTSWTQCVKASNNGVNFLSFLNGNVGYTNGDLGEIYKTTNGGNSWTSSNLPDQNWYINEMTIVNSSVMYIGGFHYASDSSFIAKTIDGGTTWTDLNIKRAKSVGQIQTFGLDTVYAFHYASDYDGTSFSYSHNGGTTWSNLKNMPNVASGNWNQGAMCFLNNNEGYLYCTTPDTILKTIDGGINWTNGGSLALLSGTDFFPGTVHYFNSNDAVAFASYGANPIVTNDAGATWTNGVHASNTSWIYSMGFAKNSQVGYANGGGGEILKTINGGLNWISVQNGFRITQFGVHFTDNQNGFTCGSLGSIYKTTNGGNTFSTLNSGISTRLISIQKIKNTNVVYTCGLAGVLLKSVDNGTTWLSQTTSITDDLHGISFTNKDTGIVVGANGKILRTLNGGTTWSLVPTSFTSKLNRVVIKGNNVYIVSDTLANAQGVFYKSTDLGQTFTSINIPSTPQNFYGISFINDSTGFIAGGFGTILRTNNNGQTWAEQLVNTTDDFFAIDFADNDKALAVGAFGLTFETNDGGVNWNQNISVLAIDLYDVSYPDVNNGWGVGRVGTVAKYSNNYSVVAINDLKEDKVSVEIYPNPSSDYIYFKTTQIFNVIELYDNLGRLIEISNYNRLQNNYSLPSGLKTGIYFIKLKGESNEINKKIIIENN